MKFHITKHLITYAQKGDNQCGVLCVLSVYLYKCASLLGKWPFCYSPREFQLPHLYLCTLLEWIGFFFRLCPGVSWFLQAFSLIFNFLRGKWAFWYLQCVWRESLGMRLPRCAFIYCFIILINLKVIIRHVNTKVLTRDIHSAFTRTAS